VVDVGNDRKIPDVVHQRTGHKKRRVETVTRLPTKRMATACWAFIVVKTTPLKTAPVLDFSSLQAANSQIHPQFFHNVLWMGWGLLRCPHFVAETG